MNNAITEVRDLNLELESLKARKDAIKKQLAEHRDTITDEEIGKQKSEVEEIRSAIKNAEE
jgi:hypothetical protein